MRFHLKSLVYNFIDNKYILPVITLNDDTITSHIGIVKKKHIIMINRGWTNIMI